MRRDSEPRSFSRRQFLKFSGEAAAVAIVNPRSLLSLSTDVQEKKQWDAEYLAKCAAGGTLVGITVGGIVGAGCTGTLVTAVAGALGGVQVGIAWSR